MGEKNNPKMGERRQTPEQRDVNGLDSGSHKLKPKQKSADRSLNGVNVK